MALGLLTPAQPLMAGLEADRVADVLSGDAHVTAEEVRVVGFALRDSVAPAERLEHALHPWTSYLIVPVFALANAGISLRPSALRDAVSSPISVGVALGLVLGKLIGISACSWLAVRWGLARLPDGLAWRHVTGMAALGGIGFTVSIFVTGLAFGDAGQQDQAKIGVLFASMVAALLGSALLLATRSRSRPSPRRAIRPARGRASPRPARHPAP